MLNVILCGYRSWALEINEYLSSLEEINCVHFISSKEGYDEVINNASLDDIDFILFVGWSWIIHNNVLNKCLCLGIHPSDLPNYRGGSPIQHQIIGGVKTTKITLMSLSEDKVDAGDIYAKEDVSFEGKNMDEVFNNIVYSSKKMLLKFISNFDKITPKTQNIYEGSYCKRRKPEDSKLDFEKIQSMQLEDLYDFIRSLTDPYPNAYLEDKDGNKLLFKQVEYIHHN